MKDNKFLLIITHAQDDQERANLALAFAAAMIAEEKDIVLLFMFDGVYLARKGGIESIAADHVTPGKDLLPVIMEGGAKLMACTPCAMQRGIREEELLEGCRLISAATVVPEMAEREVISF
ncbi:MAG: DsrE family protein [Desulfobulbaceae bacterium]|nr:DsrE family protein [Desulfobulbaceae bacterium]